MLQIGCFDSFLWAYSSWVSNYPGYLYNESLRGNCVYPGVTHQVASMIAVLICIRYYNNNLPSINITELMLEI